MIRLAALCLLLVTGLKCQFSSLSSDESIERGFVPSHHVQSLAGGNHIPSSGSFLGKSNHSPSLSGLYKTPSSPSVPGPRGSYREPAKLNQQPSRSYQPPPSTNSVSVKVPLLSGTYKAPLGPKDGSCPGNQVRNALGNCDSPEFVRDLFVFQEPASKEDGGYSQVEVPKPKVKVNLVVIRKQEGGAVQSPLVIPPPQEKTIVLVLEKEGDNGEQKVIELPAAENQRPEVFFVKYDQPDDTPLPGGVTLNEALSLAATSGGSVGGGFGGASYVR